MSSPLPTIPLRLQPLHTHTHTPTHTLTHTQTHMQAHTHTYKHTHTHTHTHPSPPPPPTHTHPPPRHHLPPLCLTLLMLPNGASRQTGKSNPSTNTVGIYLEWAFVLFNARLLDQAGHKINLGGLFWAAVRLLLLCSRASIVERTLVSPSDQLWIAAVTSPTGALRAKQIPRALTFVIPDRKSVV